MNWHPAPPSGPTVVTIGFFDGVHLGHQKLLRLARQRAADRSLLAVALTFDRHPREVLAGEEGLRYLTPLAEKRRWLFHFGAQAIAEQPFTVDFAQLSPQAFATHVLLQQCQARELVVGDDFRFGHQRRGDVAWLREWGRAQDVQIQVAPPVGDGDRRVSSSLVRAALLEGEVVRAAGWLGRPYSLAGTVQWGRGLGRRLGFPTANLAVPSGKLIPALGVYLGLALWEGNEKWAVLNIGRRPTVDAGGGVHVEAHLLDFEEDLYGCELEILLLERVRSEHAFPSLDALKAAIGRDVERGRLWIAAQGDRWLRGLQELPLWSRREAE